MCSVQAIQQILFLGAKLAHGLRVLRNWKTIHTSDANLENLPRKVREAVQWEEHLCGSSTVFV